MSNFFIALDEKYRIPNICYNIIMKQLTPNIFVSISIDDETCRYRNAALIAYTDINLFHG